jgi:ribosome-binding factor A
METKRQKQVAELVKRNFSIVLQEEGVNIYGAKAFVTVTHVIMSPDMSLAKIYFSIFNTDHVQEPLMMMEEEKLRLRGALAKRIKQHVRIIPEILFFYDDTMDEMMNVDNLFRKIENNEMGDTIQ